jgi:hypothetical protein
VAKDYCGPELKCDATFESASNPLSLGSGPNAKRLKPELKLNRKPSTLQKSPTRALKPIGYSCTNHAEHDVAPEQANA